MTEQELLALNTPEALAEIKAEKKLYRPAYIPTPADIARECRRISEQRIADMQASGGEKYRTPYVPKVVARSGTRRHGGIHSSY